VSTERRRIFAFSGVLKPQPGGSPPGALEDGVGLLYAGTRLAEAVSILPSRHAWRVAPDGNGSYTEQVIVPRLITA
jgi:hypothetical protein